MCQPPRKPRVLFTGAPVSIFSAYCSLKIIGAISTKLMYAVGPIFTTKFKRISPRRLLVTHALNLSDFICILLILSVSFQHILNKNSKRYEQRSIKILNKF